MVEKRSKFSVSVADKQKDRILDSCGGHVVGNLYLKFNVSSTEKACSNGRDSNFDSFVETERFNRIRLPLSL